MCVKNKYIFLIFKIDIHHILHFFPKSLKLAKFKMKNHFNHYIWKILIIINKILKKILYRIKTIIKILINKKIWMKINTKITITTKIKLSKIIKIIMRFKTWTQIIIINLQTIKI